MILIIDNHDSFTWNLVQYFKMLSRTVEVCSSDAMTISDIEAMAPDCLVISPGPGGPCDAGISLEAIRHFYRHIPILGVCLGHQCLAEAFGGRIIQAPQIMHGKTSRIFHESAGLFCGLPSPFEATRYHSLAVCPDTLPDCFRIDARVCGESDNTIMAITHRQYPLFGLQFHPEAILTEHGMQLLEHFLDYS